MFLSGKSIFSPYTFEYSKYIFSPMMADTCIHISNSPKEDIKSLISHDLSQKLNSYKYYSAALSSFEKQTGITKRQVERYLSMKSLPQFLNLKKIYSFITGVEDYRELLSIVPSAIRSELESKNTNKFLPSGISQKNDYSDEIINCSAFSYIYFNTVSGNHLSSSLIKNKFGEYGLKVTKKMLARDIIKKLSSDIYISGKNRSTPVNMEAASIVAQNLIENNFKYNNTAIEGNNYLGFNVFTLDERTKQIALIKMQKLHNELVELANKSKGDETPFFTVICGDSMISENLNDAAYLRN